MVASFMDPSAYFDHCAAVKFCQRAEGVGAQTCCKGILRFHNCSSFNNSAKTVFLLHIRCSLVARFFKRTDPEAISDSPIITAYFALHSSAAFNPFFKFKCLQYSSAETDFFRSSERSRNRLSFAAADRGRKNTSGEVISISTFSSSVRDWMRRSMPKAKPIPPSSGPPIAEMSLLYLPPPPRLFCLDVSPLLTSSNTM